MTPSKAARIRRLVREARAFPRVAKVGLTVMLFGFIADLVEHTVIPHADELVIAGFRASEHAAHVVVIMGMVFVLGGVLADGVRTSHGRGSRRERSRSDALR